MAIALLLVNFVACAVIWAAAMFFYLRHERPRGASQHYVQIALICIAVGAFAAVVVGATERVPPWWVISLRIGVAMLAVLPLRRAWHEWRARA
jgi:hypothetical protein